MNATNDTSPDPKPHCEKIGRELAALAEHLRRDVEKVAEPQFKALCETSAEVIGALRKSFEHYVKGAEPAWQAHGDAGR